MSYDFFVQRLAQGETVQFRPRGNSMKPKILSGEQVTISPSVDDVIVGDIVFCKVRGCYYVHLVKAMKGADENKSFQIGNNHGKTNGWISRSNLFGKVIRIEP